MDTCPGGWRLMHRDDRKTAMATFRASLLQFALLGVGVVAWTFFFLCVAADETAGNWVPLFPDPGPWRDVLGNEHKTGPAGWRSSETYFHKEQVWQAPHDAVVKAASIDLPTGSNPGRFETAAIAGSQITAATTCRRAAAESPE